MAAKSTRKKSSEDKSEHEYQGRSIHIYSTDHVVADPMGSADGTQVTIEIDGKEVEIMKVSSREFFSDRLPYRAYPSALAVAKALIDADPSFRKK